MPAPVIPSRIPFSQDVIQVMYRLVGALLICVALSFLSDAFLSYSNLMNIFRQASLVFLMSCGLTLVILTGGLDLSIGANIGLSACIAATVIKYTGSPMLGALVGVLIGSAVGLVNGLLVAKLLIPSFIATYGMLWVLHGLTYWYMGGTTIYGFPPDFRQLGIGFAFGIPIPIYIMVLFLAAGTFFTKKTTWGHDIYAIGANQVAARLSGLPVNRRLILVYTLSGAMGGLAALVFLARVNSAEADIGEALTLPAIAAVLIGGASLFGGVGTIFGTLIGAIILTLIINGMNLLSIASSWQPFITGVIVILAVWIDIASKNSAR